MLNAFASQKCSKNASIRYKSLFSSGFLRALKQATRGRLKGRFVLTRAGVVAITHEQNIINISIGNSTVSRGIWDKYRE